ncbi:Mlo-related protein [Dillenia turbinata]|uniref:MLO-like protein n=1 Tax=Dillenia turbinata TaxID=194707 RepID=A0AAN8UIX1_9MAGN
MAEDDATATASESEYSLKETPTWAVAIVCFILIFISILIERLLHLLAQYFSKKSSKGLIQALYKIKSELMLLGFISLLLTVCERPIEKICIPVTVAQTFLPCKDKNITHEEEEESCVEQDKVSLISSEGIQELHYFIFILACAHVIQCVLTFGLGMAKMKRWESWEAETRTLEYEFSNDPRRFRLIHQTSFGRRHLKCWSNHPYLRYLTRFLRQFYGSVSKVDYLTLRHGFITAHFSAGSNFDFQKYLRRALDKDFAVVVGISPWIWFFSVLFIFFNAYVFHSYFWLPFIPLLLLMLVGTKLQVIITNMCLDTNEKGPVIRGNMLVRPSDHFFWFGKPKWILYLIHFILFQNSFQLAFFSWTWFKFGLRSCFHRETEDIVIKMVMGLLVQFLCGYVTLPLYALVTQMGTSMGKAVFTEAVVEGLKKWRVMAKKNIATRNPYSARPSLDASLSIGSSPSFNTVDASYSLDYDRPSPQVDGVEDEVEVEESLRGRPKEQKKFGSFEGFELSR